MTGRECVWKGEETLSYRFVDRGMEGLEDQIRDDWRVIQLG